jgi:D-3-phosphoglycerate dehydrogenase
MATVLLTDRAWPDDTVERRVIEAAGHTLVAGPPTAASAEQVAALVREHRPQAIMTCWAPVSREAISASAQLQIVARMGVGLDNIAVADATRAGAWVTNVPDYCIEEVSDHALALVLAWARGIATLDRSVKDGAWNPAGAQLVRLSTLVAGIVGYGRIGRETARKLGAFGMRVVAFDTGASVSGANAELVPLQTLLRESDVVVLHLPLLPSTQHFADSSFFAQLKRGAFVVNVSRGPIIDNAALLSALQSGHISGAGLDVIEGEPHPPLEIVWSPNVIATPHVAFSSTTSVIELRRRAAEEVVRVLAGDQPHFPCNRPLSVARNGSSA